MMRSFFGTSFLSALLLLLILTVVAITIPVVNASSSSVSLFDMTTTTTTNENESDYDNEEHRQLQTNAIINAACNLVSRILPGDILCECALTVGFIFVCAFQNQLCLGPDSTGYCSTPTIQGDIRLLKQTVAFQFCLEDASNGGVPTAGVCFDIGGILNDDDTNSFNVLQQQSITKTSALTNIVTSKFASLFQSLLQPPQTTTTRLVDCVGTSTTDDKIQQTCNSCQLCNNNTGYIFDCTNIDEQLIQSTCTPLSILTNLYDPNQTIEFFPRLDDENDNVN